MDLGYLRIICISGFIAKIVFGYKNMLGKPQKKVPQLMARPLRPYPPPPSSLRAIGTFFFSHKIAENEF